MSSKTLYFCDQCKKEVKSSNVLTGVKLELNPYNSYKSTRFNTVYQYFDLCDQCTERLGFIVKKSEENKPPIVEPTTAEKLYDIIVQMILENIH